MRQDRGRVGCSLGRSIEGQRATGATSRSWGNKALGASAGGGTNAIWSIPPGRRTRLRCSAAAARKSVCDCAEWRSKYPGTVSVASTQRYVPPTAACTSASVKKNRCGTCASWYTALKVTIAPRLLGGKEYSKVAGVETTCSGAGLCRNPISGRVCVWRTAAGRKRRLMAPRGRVMRRNAVPRRSRALSSNGALLVERCICICAKKVAMPLPDMDAVACKRVCAGAVTCNSLSSGR